jgi:palmitoyltransferase ZDHHC9/14/18
MYVAPPPQLSVATQRGTDDNTVTWRVYQLWEGSNKFFLGGRLIFGPDVRSLFLTIFMIIVPLAIFCAFVANNLLDKFSHHLGIFIMAIAIIFTVYDLFLLLLTSGRDPGIIPRNENPPEQEEDYDTSISPAEWGGGLSRLRLPRTKDTMVNGVAVKIKYCDTCMLYRPPRCSHCSICNNCVERFDHHCPWVGQCIGQRNYRYFFMFVFSTTLLCIYVFAFCWVYIKIIMEAHQINVWRAMLKTPASIVLIIYTFIAVWFVGGLTAFHIYLISTNQTTYENFRYRYDNKENPYHRGLVQNFIEIFFTKTSPSKNNFRAKVTHEIPDYNFFGSRLETDTSDTNMGKGGGDLEIGGKPSWPSPGIETSEDLEDLQGDALEGIDTRSGIHPRRSSWGRKSGSWEITPDIIALAAGVGGEVSRANGVNTPGNR